MKKRKIAVALVMYCRAVLPVRLLVRMTAVVGLSLISLNLVPGAACAQGPPDIPGYRGSISGPHEPPIMPSWIFNLNASFTREVVPKGEPWGPGRVFQLLGPTHGELVGEVTSDSGLVPGDYTQVYLSGSYSPVVGPGGFSPSLTFVVFPVPVQGPISIYTFDPDPANPPASYQPVNGDVFHLIVTGESYTYLEWIEGHAIDPKAELAFPDLDSLFNFDNAPLAEGLSWRPAISPSGGLDLLVVPEPGALVLLISGTLGLLLMVWRRKVTAMLVRMTLVVGFFLISLSLVSDGACAQGGTFTAEVPPIGEPWGAGRVFLLLGPTHGEVWGFVTRGSGLTAGDYTQIYMAGFPEDPVVSVEGPISIYTFDPHPANPPASYQPVNGDVFHLIVTGSVGPGWLPLFPIYPKAELTSPDLETAFNFDNAPLPAGVRWRPVITPTGDLDLLVVPEPGTLLLLGTGALGLLLLVCPRNAAGSAWLSVRPGSSVQRSRVEQGSRLRRNQRFRSSVSSLPTVLAQGPQTWIAGLSCGCRRWPG